MKQLWFSVGLIGLMMVGLGLPACGDDTDVCAAQADAADACAFVSAPLESCEDNLAACGDGEREQWVKYFNCLQSHCDAGEPPIVVQQACAMELGGVSWDCAPGGSGF